jgi:predicted transcriptional regulator
MADTYVSRDQFDEFVKRIEQAFVHAEKARAQELALVNQRFELVEKRFEQIDQRFAQLDKRLDEFRADLRAEVQSVRNWMIGLYSPLVLALVAAVIKWIFFPPTP